MSVAGVSVSRVRREPHENVATVLVDPRVLGDFELELMSLDLRVWPVRTAPICADGPRQAFQIRNRLLTSHRGEWDVAADWTPVWIGFGPTWQTVTSRFPGPPTRRCGTCSTRTPSTSGSTGGSAACPAWTTPGAPAGH